MTDQVAWQIWLATIHYIWCFALILHFVTYKTKWEKYMASTKRKPAFISKGFTNCMERCYSPVKTILRDYLARCVHSCKKRFFPAFCKILQESCMHVPVRYLQDPTKCKGNILHDSWYTARKGYFPCNILVHCKFLTSCLQFAKNCTWNRRKVSCTTLVTLASNILELIITG